MHRKIFSYLHQTSTKIKGRKCLKRADLMTYLSKWGCQGRRCCCCCCTICTTLPRTTPSEPASSFRSGFRRTCSPQKWARLPREETFRDVFSLFAWNKSSSCVFMFCFDLGELSPLASDLLPCGGKNSDGEIIREAGWPSVPVTCCAFLTVMAWQI